jgi:hypothetical protein
MGVRGNSPGIGVRGEHTGSASSGEGVYGQSANGDGVFGQSTAGGNGVTGNAVSGDGVYGRSAGGSAHGVYGICNTGNGAGYGVFGTSRDHNNALGVGYGVYGESGAVGVGGTASAGTGVQGDSGTGIGVSGVSSTMQGVKGLSDGSIVGSYGVWGLQSSDYANAIGVAGEGIGGYGMYGKSVNGVGVGAHTQSDSLPAVQATSYASGSALIGRNFTDKLNGQLGTGTSVLGITGAGIGVQGTGTSGTGGSFHSDTGAPLHLDPGSAAGHPTAGYFAKGDLYVDANGSLFICSASGDYATTTKPAWRQVQTTQAIALVSGWNLVTGPGLVTSTIKSQIDAAGGDVQAIAVYKNGSYTDWVPGAGADFTVPATAGMYVLTTKAATWTPH